MTTLEAPARTVELKPAPEPKAPSIVRYVTDEHICILTFDRPNSAANVFNKPVLQELDQHLDFVTGDEQIKGIIIASAKPSIFIAGADLKSFADSPNPAELRELIELGQSVFDRLSILRIPTVAAIHGAALGGVYEVALACDYRIASPDKSTKIGLPETQLGILPAWGGSTRLPRLIGLPKALDIILAGKTVAAKQALKYGMVDELVPREYLVEAARKRILSGVAAHPKRKNRLVISLANSGAASELIYRRARATLVAKTRGHYPAPLKALDVAVKGLSGSIERSLNLELEAMEELAQTEVCRSLVRLFFLQERAKKITGGKDESKEQVAPVQKISAIGAGVMGARISH